MKLYKSYAQPPRDALKPIRGGRLKGMTDINPQWRYEALTEMFGTAGEGWAYDIIDRWTHELDGQVCVTIKVSLRWLNKGTSCWSDPIFGLGSSMLVAKESSGLRLNDEADKMALTDALSVCCKMLGIGSDIYRGRWDGSRYSNQETPAPPAPTSQQQNEDKTIDDLGGDIGTDIANDIKQCETKAQVATLLNEEILKIQPRELRLSLQKVAQERIKALA